MFAPALVETERRPDGTLLLGSPRPLEPYAATLGERLRQQPSEREFLVEGSRRVRYGQAVEIIQSAAQALVDLGLGPQKPLALLSGNGIDHALLTLAAMEAGIPAAPVSPAYSLVARDLTKLRRLLDELGPGAIYVSDRKLFARALAVAPEVPILSELPSAAPRERFSVGPDSVAKILFTSGSTGEPKGVVNTQRMLCSNQQAIAQSWPFLAERAPVTVDWLPWSHTFGGNHNFNMMLWHGGTLVIDPGKPTPEAIGATVAHLRATSPTVYFNVPRGFDMLLPFLERDAELRARFFAELDLLFYAAAALPDSLWHRLEALAPRKIPFVSAWGSTETSPLATLVHFPIERAGVIGLPAPGVAIKLAPVGDRHELRVRGPNVSPGFWRRGQVIPAALDEEGYLPMGDAGKLADAKDPARGLVFDGRLAENFKLSTGTWVSVGALRIGCVTACHPAVQDAVVCGHDRDYVALLLFARPDAREEILSGLREWNARAPHSSTRVVRALILDEPPSIDAGEITDKGYLNQRAILTRRAALVERLYRDPPPPEVLQIG